jgi:hypothetical protein
MAGLQKYKEEELIAMRSLAKKLGGSYTDATTNENFSVEEIAEEINARREGVSQYNQSEDEEEEVAEIEYDSKSSTENVNYAYQIKDDDPLINSQSFDVESEAYQDLLIVDFGDEFSYDEFINHEEDEEESDDEYDPEMVQLLHKAYTDGIVEALDIAGIDPSVLIGEYHETFLEATKKDFDEWFERNVK